MSDDAYLIETSVPEIETYHTLRVRTGLSPKSREAAEMGLAGTLFAVQVFCHGGPVGMGRLIGDGGCFFQIVDIAVLPEHQGKGLGRRIMAALMEHVESALPEGAYISLIADGPAKHLYAQFGFQPTAPQSIGMARKL